MANVTDIQDKTKYLITERFQPLPANVTVFVIVLNVVLSITSSLGNTLILIALHRVSSIFPPTKLLFRSLAVTNLCTGLISQPLFAIHTSLLWLTVTNSSLSYYIEKVGASFTFILCTVSILTSAAISVDRLLALSLGPRYKHVVTLRRTRVVAVFLWLLSFALGGWRYSTWGSTAARIAFTFALFLSLVSSVFSHINIYLRLRHRFLQVRVDQPQQTSNGGASFLNKERYRRMASSIAWLQGTLLVCYLPFIVVSVLYAYSKIPRSACGNLIFRVAISILYLNSSVNPFLYCWKIREVGKIVKDTIKQLNCCCRSK